MAVHEFHPPTEAIEEVGLSASTRSGMGLVGVSPRMRQVIAQCEAAGATRGGVCITGEADTGRALLARAIHRCGITANGPFVPLFCDQIQPSEADALLFGARSSGPRPAAPLSSLEAVTPGSVLNRARGGTLYLHHPEDLPDRVQSRLARALRDDEVVLSGASESCPLCLRAIVAFDTDPSQPIFAARIRPDFFRRVSGVTIEVPPLRERREDIPLLAAHFLARACRAVGLPAKRLTPGGATLLAALPWPGNNRDLQAVLAAAVRTSTEPEIDLDDLLALVRLDAAAHPSIRAGGLPVTLREARLAFEREYIASVLAQQHGRIPDAARILGLQRTNLYRKLRALRLPRPTQAPESPASKRHILS